MAMDINNFNSYQPTPSPVPAPKKRKRIVVLIAVSFLVIVACVLYWMGIFKSETPASLADADLKSIPENVLPSQFPVGFPLGKQGEVVQNYDYETPDIIQSTRKFATTETPEAFYAKAKKYFSEQLWAYSDLNKVSETYYNFNGNDRMTKEINVNINKGDEKNWIVEVSFTNKRIIRYEEIPAPNPSE